MISLTINNYGLLAVALIILVPAVFVLIQDPRNRINQSFFTFALGGALWVLGIALISLTQSFAFDVLIEDGGLVFLGGFFWLSQEFPTRLRIGIPWYIMYAPFAVMALFVVPTGLVNIGMTIDAHGGLHPMAGPFIVPYTLLTLTYTLLGIYIFASKYKGLNERDRLCLKYLFLGTGIFMLGSVLFDSVLPAFGFVSWNLLGPVTSLIFVAITAYAILHHQLMDIRIIIQRGLIYTTLLALIIVCYIGIITTVGIIIQKDPDAVFITTGIITTIIGIFGVPVIARYFRKKTDHIFFKDKYDYGNALRTLSETLQESVELGGLVEHAQDDLKNILRAESASILLGEDTIVSTAHEDMATSDVESGAVRIPIKLDNRPIGEIFVGKKRSGDAYTSEDVRLLETFAYQAGTAFGRVILFNEVKRHARDLEEKVAERTGELLTIQENQKQMMIDISHNLQTPLTIFQTKLYQLKKVLPDDEGVLQFERSLADLSVFIYELLSLARLEHDTSRFAGSVDLSALLTDIVEEVTVIAAQYDISVRDLISPDISVVGDGGKLKEAVMNIASNAIKYMGHGEKREITFALEKEDASVVLSIRDTGIGIEEKDAKRIFERFYRIHKGEDAVAGTGLGLAITKQIIERHGGTISLESEIGKGTEVRVLLPAISAIVTA